MLHVPGRSTNTGTYTGRDAVLGFVVHAAELTGGTLDLNVHRVFDDGEWGVALCTYTATRPDRARKRCLDTMTPRRSVMVSVSVRRLARARGTRTRRVKR